MQPPKNAEVIETLTEKIWLGEDGIMRYLALPVKEHTLKDAKENSQAGLKLSDKKCLPTIIDIREIKFISRDARIYYAGVENSIVVSACAMLIDNSLSKVIGNFFIGLNKTGFSFKLFMSEEKSMKWLKKFQNE